MFFKFLIAILFSVLRQHIESKKHKINLDRRKIEEILFAMFSELVEISCFFSASSGYHI
jgi:hypothetical protein